MPSYVVLLRAVNVGKRQVRMAQLRDWLAEAGFTGVETYIQTGNVRVSTPTRSPVRVQQRLEALLRERCGFDVACIVLTPEELSGVYRDAVALAPPFPEAEEQRRYVVFFPEPLDAETVEAMAAYDPGRERIWAVGRAAHVWIAGSFAEAAVFRAFEKVLAPGTSRALQVVAALAERWGR